MKHATHATLEQLASLLERLSAVVGLVQRSRGVYYFKSKAFLHFHEDPAGIFADVNVAGEWKRVRVGSPQDESELLQLVSEEISARAAAKASGPS